jgi:hypothetical protein
MELLADGFLNEQNPFIVPVATAWEPGFADFKNAPPATGKLQIFFKSNLEIRSRLAYLCVRFSGYSLEKAILTLILNELQ